MFPFEIITMLGSTLLSSVLSLWSQRMKAKQDEQKMLITRGEFQLKAVESARNVQDKGFQWTRRIIALSARSLSMDNFPRLGNYATRYQLSISYYRHVLWW